MAKGQIPIVYLLLRFGHLFSRRSRLHSVAEVNILACKLPIHAYTIAISASTLVISECTVLISLRMEVLARQAESVQRQLR